MSARGGGPGPAHRGAGGRRRAWDWPAVLVLSGLAAKALLSTTVDETLGTWVGAVLAFAGTVTFVVSTWSTVRRGSAEDEPDRDAASRGGRDAGRRR